MTLWRGRLAALGVSSRIRTQEHRATDGLLDVLLAAAYPLTLDPERSSIPATADRSAPAHPEIVTGGFRAFPLT